MTKPTFTKGPWHAFEQNGSNPKTKGLFAITAPHESGSQQTVAVTPFAGDGNELWANARLIAAAPELFEQCKFLEKVLTEAIMTGDSGADLELDELRELLAKVEGEK